MTNMKSLLTFAALASLSVALPEKRDDTHITLAPGPEVASSCVVTTTVPNTQPINCPLMPVCGAVPECIVQKTTTVSVPCRINCPFTPTVTVTGSASCPTCQSGCATRLVTATTTGSCTTTSSVRSTYY